MEVPPASSTSAAGLIYISFDDDEGAKDDRRTPPRRLQERLRLSKHHQAAHSRRHLQVDSPSAQQQQENASGPWVDWTSLPDEIVWQIFSYLDVWAIIQVGQSSKTWRRISQDQYIGTTLDFSKFKAHLQDEHFTLILERIHAPRLKTINLHGCSSVTGKAIARIPEQCPSLTSLLLSGCLAVNNFALYSLLTREGITPEQAPPSRPMTSRARRQWYLAQLNQWNRGDWRPMTSLAVLRLSYCSHVSDKAVEWVLRCCPNLEELYLSGCQRITDQSCQLLAGPAGKGRDGRLAPAKGAPAAHRGVRVLDLTGCYRITVRGLVAMLSGLGSLATLYAPPCLGQWDAFTDARLWLDSALAFPHVEALHLSGMAIKQDAITETLPKRFPNLVALDLSGSKLLSAHAGRGDDEEDGLDWTEEGEGEGGEGEGEGEHDDGGGGGGDRDDGTSAEERRRRRRMEDAWAGMLAAMGQLRDINLRACAGVRRGVLADLQVAFPHVRLSF